LVIVFFIINQQLVHKVALEHMASSSSLLLLTPLFISAVYEGEIEMNDFIIQPCSLMQPNEQ